MARRIINAKKEITLKQSVLDWLWNYLDEYLDSYDKESIKQNLAETQQKAFQVNILGATMPEQKELLSKNLQDYSKDIARYDQEKADIKEVDIIGKVLENRVKDCAWDICTKYLNPPKTTDFGILFLPIEGLFAEVIRRAGLTEFIQRECRVVIAGPTTLWALLNSLQMGFRTLAIQKRSSEVWNLLAAVKTEWTKYGDVLDAVQKKINQASETIEKAKMRSRAVGKKLKDVQELPSSEVATLLPKNLLEDDTEAGEDDKVEGD